MNFTQSHHNCHLINKRFSYVEISFKIRDSKMRQKLLSGFQCRVAITVMLYLFDSIREPKIMQI